MSRSLDLSTLCEEYVDSFRSISPDQLRIEDDIYSQLAERLYSDL